MVGWGGRFNQTTAHDNSANPTEPLKGHGGGKTEVGGKNLGWEEKVFFNFFAFSHKTSAFPQETLHSLAKLLHSLAKTFALPLKTFAFSRQNICISSQNFCVLLQNQLSSDKHFLFSLQLAVVHRALYIHNVALHRVL